MVGNPQAYSDPFWFVVEWIWWDFAGLIVGLALVVLIGHRKRKT